MDKLVGVSVYMTVGGIDGLLVGEGVGKRGQYSYKGSSNSIYKERKG